MKNMFAAKDKGLNDQRRYLLWHIKVCESSESGFSLIELVVSTFLLSLIIVATASFFTTATTSTRRSGAYSEINALIEQDLAKIRAISDRFSCCSGLCTSSVTTNAVCGESLKFDSLDYFPKPGSSGFTQARDDFIAACRNPNDTAHLTGLLIGQLPSTPPAGLTRSISKDKPGEPSDYLVRIAYASDGSNSLYPRTLRRIYKLLPPVSAWCP